MMIAEGEDSGQGDRPLPSENTNPSQVKGTLEQPAFGETPFPQSNVIATSLQYRSSQFPPVKEVQGYERVLPGSWNRILTMAEKAQDTEIETNKNILKQESIEQESERQSQRRLQFFGFASMTLSMIGALIAVGLHAPWPVPVAFLSVPVLAVAGKFIDSARGKP